MMTIAKFVFGCVLIAFGLCVSALCASQRINDYFAARGR